MKISKIRVVTVAWIFLLAAYSCAEQTPIEVGNPKTNDDGGAQLAGKLKLDNDAPAAGAQISVASHPEYKATADKNGEFRLAGMVPGNYTVYATVSGGLSAARKNTRSSSGEKAAQFADVVISAGESTEIGKERRLTTPGSVSGSVSLINNPLNVPLAGIEIYVPGTGYGAKTDENGAFVMAGIPAGVYTVAFARDGLTGYSQGDITVATASDTALPTVRLSLSSGPAGRIAGLNGATELDIAGTTRTVLPLATVSVLLTFDSRAVLMKVAHESAFVNVDWAPVAEQFVFSAEDNPAAIAAFADDGEKNIYVQFADLNGLESTIYHKSFILDTRPPEIGAFTVMNDWPEIANNAATIYSDQTANDAGVGVKEMRFSSNSLFAGAEAWKPYANRGNWNSNAGAAGARSYFLKVRDWLGRESTVASDDITGGIYTVIAPRVHADPVTLGAAHSPFRYYGDVTFANDLTIEPGVSLIHDSAG